MHSSHKTKLPEVLFADVTENKANVEKTSFVSQELITKLFFLIKHPTVPSQLPVKRTSTILTLSKVTFLQQHCNLVCVNLV